ncbi:hypothetical protein P5G65_24190 [Paenibacillus chondroitinus]|uniref:Uncharacterized protein n=1 Tax=Paenibacillus chondroitinus TaxID=59842 RepID=A0ABU6DGX4_9BACL|nr:MULTISPECIES: hypothetical protein [Paenibacillus]MCY9659609.1 hypothetical protein [Paenibacillus anseongense]MEB4797005.1 hypothetical protein [Paenibacillus chondroitinus]
MKYRVRHKMTGEEKTLSHLEVNDMDYDANDRIVVFDTNMEVYFLIDEVQE